MSAILLSVDSLQLLHPVVYFWADSFFKASLIILLAGLFHWAYRSQSASSHGLIWLIAIVSCLFIPFFKLFVPVIDVPIAIQQSDSLSIVSTAMADNRHDSESLTLTKYLLLQALKTIYLAGLLVMLTNLIVSIARLIKISNQGSKCLHGKYQRTLQRLMQSHGITAKVTLLVSSQTPTPFTWGIFHHHLVLPAAAMQWDQQLLRQAIGHELGHIQRNDWIYQLLGRVTLCLYWPNPLLWYATRSLKIASEKASDDTAAGCSDSDIDYASNLLQLATCMRIPEHDTRLAMGMFSSPSVLALRIRHILLADRNRSLLRADEILTSTVMMLILVVPLSSFQVSASIVEPATNEIETIPLAFDSSKSDATLNIENELRLRIPPLRLPSEKLAPALRIEPEKRRARLNIVAKPLSVNTGEQFRLATDELFLQWEATPLQIPAPEYPLIALRKGIEGYVVAEFSLDNDGNTINPRIIESVPTGIFDRAVLRAVEKFIYCPEIVDGIGGNNQPIRKRFSFALQN